MGINSGGPRRWMRFFCWLAISFFIGIHAAQANIVVRGLIINSSKTQKKKVPFKYYLPKEIKPNNIVDMGELELAFDPKENVYYVFKDFDVEPKATLSVDIELEDVWKIAQPDLDAVRTEKNKVMEILAKSDYYERGLYLANSIESKISEIENKQLVGNADPSAYIMDYRDNLLIFDLAKEDLAALKKLMTDAKVISPQLSWKLILSIVAFLGLLGAILFVVWQRQMKNLTDLGEERTVPESGQGRMQAGERRETQPEQPAGLSDIEERLKQKD